MLPGVCVMGVNNGCSGTHRVRESRLIRTYMVSGKFGLATDNQFHDGKVGGELDAAWKNMYVSNFLVTVFKNISMTFKWGFALPSQPLQMMAVSTETAWWIMYLLCISIFCMQDYSQNSHSKCNIRGLFPAQDDSKILSHWEFVGPANPLPANQWVDTINTLLHGIAFCPMQLQPTSSGFPKQ